MATAARGGSGGSAHLTLNQIMAIRSLGGNEAPQWTPDGKGLIFVSGLGGSPEIWSASLDDGMLSRLSTGLGGLTYAGCGYSPKWSPSGEYVAVVSAKSGNDEVWLWPTDGSPGFQLTALGARVEALSWAPDGRALAVASSTYGAFDIFRVAVPDGETIKLTNHHLYEIYPSFTPDGRILYVRLNDAWTDHEVILMNGDGSEPRVVLRDRDFFDYHYGRAFGHPKVAPDGKRFLFQSERSGWLNTWVAPVEGGEPRQIASAEADQTGAAWSPDGRSIAYLENHNGTVGIGVVAAEGGEPRRLFTPELGVCAGLAWSPDGARLSYLYGTPGTPNDVWVIEVADGRRRQLTRSMLGLGGEVAERLVTPEKIAYRSFDGLEINAYLYRPPGAQERECPGIVWAHGGPTGQYMDTYQPQVQFFARNGYAVLLPNIRGSSGYGKAFEALNDRDWGGGDLKDCIAGGDFLRTLAEVDPGNIGITGASYGGTMGMFAVAFAPPGTFQAAIPCSGYCDFVRGFDERELRSQKMYEYELGDRSDPENYRRFSSIYFVEQATTPCFIIHGQGRYPGSAHAKEFALALEANYKPVWYKAYQGENYYVTGSKVPEMLRDMKAFFDLYLKGIPHNLPEDGTRPLTHLSGIISPPSAGLLTRPLTGGADSHIMPVQPPRDVAP